MAAISSMITSYPKSLQPHMDKLEAWTDLHSLFEVIREPISFKVQTAGIDTSCWDMKKRVVYLNPSIFKERTFDDQMALIIFELNNAKNNSRLLKVRNKITEMPRAEYVEAIARLEHETLISTSWFVSLLIQKGKLDSQTAYQSPVFSDFQRHFLFQQIRGRYADRIAARWDNENRVPTALFQKTWPKPINSSAREKLEDFTSWTSLYEKTRDCRYLALTEQRFSNAVDPYMKANYLFFMRGEVAEPRETRVLAET